MERSKFLGSARVLADLNPNVETWFPDDKRNKSTRTTHCGPSFERRSTTGTLVDSAKENELSSALANSVVPGTGVYFCDASSENGGKSAGFCPDLQDLVTLTIVACELEASSRRHQFLKKRRTPRNLTCLKRSLSNNPGRKLPEEFGGLAPATNQPDEPPNLEYNFTQNDAPWVPDVVSSLESSDGREMENRVRGGSPNVKPLPTTTHSEALAPPPRLTVEAFNWPVEVSTAPQTNGVNNARHFAPQTHVHIHETRVQRFAKRILLFVGKRTIAEKFIRKSLGNNPDTSKALRLLLKQQKIHRVGEGGRGKAFEYVVTTTGLEELERSKIVAREREQEDAFSLITIPQTISAM